MSRPGLLQRGDSPWVLGGLCVMIAVAGWLAGCPGTAGPCVEGGCPVIPGCEDNPITCDPDHVCASAVCEGVGWICGVDATGTYAWYRSSAPCDDGDPCTTGDVCVNKACQSTRMSCTTPPDNVCADSLTLQSWDPNGFCQDGECVYAAVPVPCASGCADGQCVGEPCTGVSCDNPGPCQTNGRCVGGACVYDDVAAGSPCDPEDPCVTGATCDDQGQCTGSVTSCDRPNTTGGICVSGECQGLECAAGWGNCDDDWSNGCEIPVGVANRCSRDGLGAFTGDRPPCGTAYCGKAPSGAVAEQFSSWYCLHCQHCLEKPNGYEAWCLTDKIRLSRDNCTTSGCCTSTYPQVCTP